MNDIELTSPENLNLRTESYLFEKTFSLDVKQVKKDLSKLKHDRSLRLGNMFAFCYDKKGEPWFVIGPHCKIF